MAKWLFVVESNCADATREAEFNKWYNKIHLPDVLKTPGFIKATRYEITEPSEGKGKFIATYEIETNDIGETMKTLYDNVAKMRAEGRHSELFVRVSRVVYKQISSVSK